MAPTALLRTARVSFVALVVIISGAHSVSANPSSSKAVEDFTYFWDFEGGPTISGNSLGFDLYNNATGNLGSDNVADFHRNAGSNPTYSNGVITLANGTNVFNDIWDVAGSLTTNSSYTIEYRVKASSTSGKGVAMYETPSTSNSAIGGIGLLNTGTSTNVYYGIDTGVQSGSLRATVPTDYINIRLAAEYNSSISDYRYNMYVNGQWAGTDLNKSKTIGNIDRLVFGDLGSDYVGSLQLDHLGFTPGAYRPGLTFHPSATVLSFNETREVDKLSNGDLMMVRYIGSTGYTNFYTSPNDGQNWFDDGDVDQDGLVSQGQALDGFVRQISGNNLMLVYHDRLNIVDGWDHTNHEATSNGRFDLWTMHSTNGGLTWKDRTRLHSGYSSQSRGFTVTSSGTTLVPIAYLDQSLDRVVAKVMRSQNNGVSWTSQGIGTTGSPLDIGGYGVEDGLMEPTIAQLSNGDVLMVMRSSEGELYSSKSTNDGATWTSPTATGLAASSSPAYMITLVNGDTVLIYNQIQPEFANSWSTWAKNDIDLADEPTSYYREEVSYSITTDGSTWSDPVVIASNPGGVLSPSTYLTNLYMFERADNLVWMKIGSKWIEMDFNTNPEPSTLAVLLLGAAGLFGRSGRRRS